MKIQKNSKIQNTKSGNLRRFAVSSIVSGASEPGVLRGLLQRVAACCSDLQGLAMRCSVLKRVAISCASEPDLLVLLIYVR